MTVATSLQKWQDELETLTAIPAPTENQIGRMVDLRTSIDAYESMVEGIGELPQHECIDRANQQAN
jgi:hypothetical protein